MSEFSEPVADRPGTGDEGSPRGRRLRLVALLLLLVVLVVTVIRVIAAVGPPTREQLREQAGLAGKQTLYIGVKDDQPGVSQQLENGAFEGFDIEIAYMIAEDLGFDAPRVRFLAIESEDRARRQARDVDGSYVTVDLVVASYSITKQRQEQGVVFSAPYLETEQSVLTLASYEGTVTSLRDLADKRVCTLGTSTAESGLEQRVPRAYGRNRISGCIQELHDGDVDAVISDAAILAGFVGPRPPGELPPKNKLERVKKLRHWDIGDDRAERYGVNAGPNPALRDLVNLSLQESAEGPDGARWRVAFDRYLRSEQQYNNPQQVAVDRQPQPEPEDRVEVRQWPWERFALPYPHRSPPAWSSGVARARVRRSSGC
ncbi:transporter substrate-binding domain-containing protein [Micromonospora endophytica]|uniref:Glutamate ABC transporter substrate-binding protein n=1 Tax=Micromonospora endophytica TaxID=515350 RepID=A0A2W2CKR9_9ACTN|nr:transporter substrate-binding domain-containing protein [Micromonospora endophytica]PZF98540.1 glutamate ABC transporter substrate-binding protein [Micromonospora endophytica]RIW43550.1 glutamate ABC transporter substrate-binding protein [Micromonospora endophytica]BCJ62856.1 ABC transporter substrate-binding protein [Micromonospora endophytica]